MRYPVYQINAFSDQPFGGNSACVVPLTAWLPDDLMLAIAKQNAVAETAFFIEQGTSVALRWFTPDHEIDLCGHATLATAHCLIEHRNYTTKPIHFTTQSGSLYVTVQHGRYQLDMPARPGVVSELPKVIIQALSLQPKEVDLDEVREILNKAPGVVVVDDLANNNYPMPLDAQGKDEVFVGRIRKDESQENGLNLWIVADNLRKGAATNTVQIAEYLIR